MEGDTSSHTRCSLPRIIVCGIIFILKLICGRLFDIKDRQSLYFLKQVTPYIFFSQCIFLHVVPCGVSNCSRCFRPVLLQHGAEPSIRNTDGRTALDLAEASAKAVLTGESISHASLKPVLLKQSFPKSVDFSHVTQTNPLAFFFLPHRRVQKRRTPRECKVLSSRLESFLRAFSDQYNRMPRRFITVMYLSRVLCVSCAGVETRRS